MLSYIELIRLLATNFHRGDHTRPETLLDICLFAKFDSIDVFSNGIVKLDSSSRRSVLFIIPSFHISHGITILADTSRVAALDYNINYIALDLVPQFATAARPYKNVYIAGFGDAGAVAIATAYYLNKFHKLNRNLTVYAVGSRPFANTAFNEYCTQNFAISLVILEGDHVALPRLSRFEHPFDARLYMAYQPRNSKWLCKSLNNLEYYETALAPTAHDSSISGRENECFDAVC